MQINLTQILFFESPANNIINEVIEERFGAPATNVSLLIVGKELKDFKNFAFK